MTTDPIEPRETPFRLPDTVIRPRLNRIERGDEVVTLEPKVMGVLARLAARPGDVVTRDELLATVWRDVVVGDDVLTRAVSEIRKTLDDSPERGGVIETIPRVGYRLVAPVEEIRATEPSGDWPRWRRWAAVALLALAIGAVGALAISGPEDLPTRLAEGRTFPLTTLPGREMTAAISPDGRRIAFARGEDGAPTRLYASPIEEIDPLRLTDGTGHDLGPAWSPDGTRIAFVRRGAVESCGVYVVPALGGPARRLAGCRHAGGIRLSWHPDGRWIASTTRAREGAQRRVVLLDASDGTPKPLDLPAADYRAPTFSPDGERLAVIRSEGNETAEIAIVSLGPDLSPVAPPRRVTGDRRSITGVAWTPDGESIVFSSNRSGAYGLWRVPVRGGEPTWLGSPADVHAPVVGPDGAVVYEQWSLDLNVWEIDLVDRAERSERPLLRSTRMDLYPAFSPAGDRLAFVSDRTGTVEVWTADARGGDPVRRSHLGSWFARLPRWSPDGRRIAFEAYVDGHADVWVIDRLGEPARRLTSGTGDEVAPSWSRDGRWIYFGADRDDGWQVYRIPVGGGDFERVTRHGGFAAHEGPEGRTLYYSKTDHAGVWARPVAGGAERRVVTGLESVDRESWHPVAGGLVFLDRGDDGVALARWDDATGEVRPVAPLGEAVNVGLALDPDGSRALIVREDRAESDLVIVRPDDG